MNDQEFLHAFETGHLDSFHHRDHLRMAWLYLRLYGWDTGVIKIRAGVQHFATAHGAASKYHETITVFWAHLLQYAIALEPEIADFDQFIERYRHLLEVDLIRRHYNPALLSSPAAHQTWTEPDLLPMPVTP